MIDVGALSALVAGSGPAVELRSPFDGRRTGTVPTSTVGDVQQAAAAARAAQAGWAQRSLDSRAGLLLRFHDEILDRRDQFADLIQLEGGKARLSAMEEVLHVALTARYYGLSARRHLRDERGEGLVPGLTRIDRRFIPKGLVGIIGPWNYPLTMAISDGLAALVAGNAVLLKPDAQTPLVALAAVRLLLDCGLPEGVWQVVNGEGDVVGPALIDEADYVCFTGSTATGRTVAARCAQRLIGCSLELGGKNPLLVLDDADLAAAIPGIVRACFANAGQLCVSAERIYVARPIADAFRKAFVAAVAAVRMGASPRYDIDVGCLISGAQLARTTAHVEDARAKGAQVLTGGRPRPDLGPLFYEPTVLTGVTPAMTCFAEETFGPLVSLYEVDDDEEAVRRANASPYGLNASVWTADVRRGRSVAGRIRCGTVNVNEGFGATFGSIDAPMGGMKESGLGRRQGREGVRRFVDVQAIGTQSLVPLSPGPLLTPAVLAGGVALGSRLLRRIGRA